MEITNNANTLLYNSALVITIITTVKGSKVRAPGPLTSTVQRECIIEHKLFSGAKTDLFVTTEHGFRRICPDLNSGGAKKKKVRVKK